VFRNIDLLKHNESSAWFYGAISIMCQDSITYRNILFENIRVEDFTEGSLVDLRIGCFWKTSVSGMEISGIHFKNISYEGRGEKPSRIQVLKGQGTIRDIWFENFRINGKPVRSNRDWDLKVDPGIEIQYK
jgi:hypothetical protein